MRRPTMSTILVDILAVLFGISSWVEINGLWTELPVLVQDLPEGWNLASHIVFASQLANIGPILYSAVRRCFSQKDLEVPVIHTTLAVGLISCTLLTLFWKKTTYIGGGEHSTALLALAFALAFVDCTSSVLYLPFMANFRERYVLSYLIGEGMSGLLPSMVALAQGVGGNPECRNVTTDTGNGTIYKLEPYHSPPRFSVQVFFAVLTIMVLISWCAFILLNVLPQAKKEWVVVIPVTGPRIPAETENFMSSCQHDLSSSTETTPSTELLNKRTVLPIKRYLALLAIQAYVSLMHNVLLSIQTYSCLPYGNMPYHLAVNLSGITTPILCFVAMFVWVKSLRLITLLTIFASGWGGYVLSTAVLSPVPPLVDKPLGAVLVVVSWIFVIATMAYVKACVVANFRREGGQIALFWCGVVTQTGSAVGALLTFFLVNYTGIFHSYRPC